MESKFQNWNEQASNQIFIIDAPSIIYTFLQTLKQFLNVNQFLRFSYWQQVEKCILSFLTQSSFALLFASISTIYPNDAYLRHKDLLTQLLKSISSEAFAAVRLLSSWVDAFGILLYKSKVWNDWPFIGITRVSEIVYHLILFEYLSSNQNL